MVLASQNFPGPTDPERLRQVAVSENSPNVSGVWGSQKDYNFINSMEVAERFSLPAKTLWMGMRNKSAVTCDDWLTSETK